ncbi:MAG: hypothetical protein MJ092_03850 [Lachnospiraceae bacterium]|nr:hypothetical protein [Lachnospiraceae bacterium]
MKKKMLTISLIVICLSLLAFGTVAYFTTEDTAVNVITASNIKIDLQESMLSDSGELVPFEDQLDVMPGAKVSKIMQVANTGDQPAYIRVKLEKEICLQDSSRVDGSILQLDINTAFWTEMDGFYYYNAALDPEETTEPLFHTVTFPTDMGNEYQNSVATISVTAQGTQVAHNGDSALTALGWPEE